MSQVSHFDNFYCCLSKKDEARIRRKKFVKYGVRLYQAALDGDWEKASRIFEKDRSWITAPITKHEDTVLHIAAASKHPHFVTKLLGLMIEEDLEITNTNRNTAFCFAASSGNVDIAKVMVKKNQKLPNIKGNANMTPLLMAILLRHRPMVDYLMDVTNHQQLKDHDRIALLTSAVEAGLFGIPTFQLSFHLTRVILSVPICLSHILFLSVSICVLHILLCLP